MTRPAQSPPSLTFAYLSAAAFVVALGVAALFIAFADRLAFLSSSLYFIVLVPIALAAAAFLSGAMRSHARYRGQVLKGSLELGGPVVVFGLVMLGGFMLAEPAPTTSVTVRVFGEGGRSEPLDAGEVVLDLGDDRRIRPIGQDGQVTFAQVPVRFLSAPVEAFARVERYRMSEEGPFVISPQGIVEIRMERIPDSTAVAGTVLGAAGPVEGVLVNFGNGLVTTTSDENGNFRVTLPIAEGAIVPVTATHDGRMLYDDNYVVTPTVGLRISLRGESR